MYASKNEERYHYMILKNHYYCIVDEIEKFGDENDSCELELETAKKMYEYYKNAEESVE